VSGKSDSVVSGVSVTDYDISRDEKEVAFTTTDSAGASQIWLAPLDRRTPPQLIAQAGDQVSFGIDGTLVFRSVEEKTNRLVRIKKDGTRREPITTASVLDKFGASPAGGWVAIHSPGAGENGRSSAIAVPTRGGAPRRICDPGCRAQWSSDGRFLYLATPVKTFAIPVPAGKSLPDLPASGIDLSLEVKLPGVQIIEHEGSLSPGSDPSTYVFTKTNLQRNLFRIPLH